MRETAHTAAQGIGAVSRPASGLSADHHQYRGLPQPS